MNYRHAFHAGNFADVFKHSVLCLLLGHLAGKDTPFRVIDTHAGRGRYDLAGEEAVRTGESTSGIGRVPPTAPWPPGLDGLMAVVRSVNDDWPALRIYPGSPTIIRAALRPADRLTLVELSPDEVRFLRSDFAGDSRIVIRPGDAYAALKALLPPPERRGLVLIDPPFEDRDEFRLILAGLKQALRRWPTGIYAVWYPTKAADLVERFTAELGQLGRPCLTAEFHMAACPDGERLNGCGLAILNPPWKLEDALAQLLPALRSALGATGEARVRWLAGEPAPDSTNR
jgi:23S rRNA (adenine2030-N6)-methyltransferase